MQDDDTILVCPGSTFVGFRKVKKGNRVQVNYFEKFKSIHVTLNENDVDEFIEEISQCTNKLSDVFSVKVNEITEEIVKHFRFVQKSIYFDEQPVLIDPYILGLWLGDGSSNCCALTTIDKPLHDIWCTYLESQGLRIRREEKDRVTECKENELDKVATIHGSKLSGRTNVFINSLKKMNVFKNKHIPSEYLNNSEKNRLDLLAGLIDTDGSIVRSSYEITQKNRTLSEDIVSLCKSLGFYTTMKETIKKCTNSNRNHSGTYYRIKIFLSRFTKNIPVRLERKVHSGSITCSNCPKFNTNGVPVSGKRKTWWTHELNQIVFNVVESFKKQEPGQQIPWTKLQDYHKALNGISPEAIRSQYKDKIEPNSENYIFIHIWLDLIPHEWKEKCDKICMLIQNNEFTKNTKEYQWYMNNLQFKNSMYICKRNLLDNISTLMPKTYRAKFFEDLCILRDIIQDGHEIENVRLIEGKLFIPARTAWNNIGSTVTYFKQTLKSEKVNWNNVTSKDELLEKYSGVLHDFHLGRCSKTAVVQYDANGNITNTFNSCAEAANYLNNKRIIKSVETGKRNISNACKNKTSFGDYYWKMIIDI